MNIAAFFNAFFMHLKIIALHNDFLSLIIGSNIEIFNYFLRDGYSKLILFGLS